ncbi:hypothetical protein N7508_010378 [Penicillium antarcticum]|uniref:uncharacterized protein n=1 Tax=Penicillium antarcticum TaxID=416450 RepID=UPI0023A0952E|nr:uncharacterized protein N7508_010378 [Penicillium antarcticum]KAJ5295557.1 hypothetical protein N7508_010378 [Penicillium antarcticum]
MLLFELLHWSDQWASYDDDDNYKLKIEFAQKTCLGGVIVWAVSHDTADGKSTNTLAGWAPQSKSMILWEVDNDVVTTSRSDPGHRDGELMLEERVCEDGLLHTLCCSKEAVPKCGWYTHNNGKCDSTCPNVMFEVGLTTTACSSGYQAASCEKVKDSTKLYVDLLQWLDHFPGNCALGDCLANGGSKSDILVEERAGSGDAMCWATEIDVWKNTWAFPSRKLCCGSDVKDGNWEDCDWYGSI